MVKLFDAKLDILFDNISTAVDEYTNTHDIKAIETIKVLLMDTFDVKYVNVWKYDALKKQIISLDEKRVSIPLEKSLTQNVIRSQKSQIENHIRSHKSYNTKVDNPFNERVKSMILCPIVKNKTVVGLISLAKDVRDKTLFKPEVLLMLNKVQSNLVPLIDNFHTPLPTHKKEVVKKREVVEKRVSLKKWVSASVKDKAKRLTDVATVVKEVIKVPIEKPSISRIEQEKIKTYEVENKILHLDLLALKKEMAELKASNTVNLQVSQEHKEQLQVIEKLTISEKMSHKHVHYLESKIKTLEEENIIFDMQKKNEQIEDESGLCSIENLLMQTLPSIMRYEYIYILYECIMYESMGTSMRVAEIENKIKKSKLLSELLREESCSQSIPIHDKTINLNRFIAKLTLLQKEFLGDTFLVEIKSNSEIPTVLIFDMEKVLNTCLHLMRDIVPYINTSTPLYVMLDYIDNNLYIYIKGKKHASLERLLYKNKFTSQIKDRVAYGMSKKILCILSGTVESYTDEEYCIHQISVPARLA